MTWLKSVFKKRSNAAGSRSSRRLPKRVLAPVAEIVEQGLMVARVAVRMTVKNEIIMNALQRKESHDPAQIQKMVQAATESLAAEREQDAANISRTIKQIRMSRRSGHRSGHYSSGDASTLQHRKQVYEGVAAELRKWAEDPEFLETTAKQATEQAWQEIGDSLKERASHPYYSGGNSEEYRAARDERIRALIADDLTELVKQSQRRDKGQKKVWPWKK